MAFLPPQSGTFRQLECKLVQKTVDKAANAGKFMQKHEISGRI